MTNLIEIDYEIPFVEIKTLKQFQMMVILIDRGHAQFEDFTDENGNTLLHQLIAHESEQDVLTLLPRFLGKIDHCNRLQQTALMHAAFLGKVQVVKALINFGANINKKDVYDFTALLFAMKSNKFYIVIYLIGKGADYQVQDKNNCNICHWAAFNNNLLLLKLFTMHFKVKATQRDAKGCTPAGRALQSCALDCLTFLLKRYPDPELAGKLPSKGVAYQIKNRPGYGSSLMRAINFSFIILVNVYLADYFRRLEDSNFQPLTAILEYPVYYLILLNCILFYFFKDPGQARDGLDLVQKQEVQMCDPDNAFLEIDGAEVPLIEESQAQSVDLNTEVKDLYERSVLGYIVKQIDSGKALSFQPDELCFDCLKVKRPRTVHCERCRVCHPNFCMFSGFYQRCISTGLHFFFYFIQFQVQFFAILIYLILKVNSKQLRQIYWPLRMLESVWVEESIVDQLALVIGMVMTLHMGLYLVVLFASILFRKTIYELLHREKCWYLYRDGQYYQFWYRLLIR